MGSSVLLFRDPAQDAGSLASLDTHRAVLPAVPDHVSPVQRRVLMALCRPYKNGSGFTAPATNQQIAAEVFLSVDRVKAHLRILFEKFGVTELPQNRKRLELVQRALLSGLVTLGDL